MFGPHPRPLPLGEGTFCLHSWLIFSFTYPCEPVKGEGTFAYACEPIEGEGIFVIASKVVEIDSDDGVAYSQRGSSRAAARTQLIIMYWEVKVHDKSG